MLGLIGGGLDDTAIEERLNLLRNQVRNHVTRPDAKIGVNRRSAAVIWEARNDAVAQRFGSHWEGRPCLT